MLENDLCVTRMSQAVLELLIFKVGPGNHQRGIFLLQKFLGNLRKYETHFTENDITADKS